MKIKVGAARILLLGMGVITLAGIASIVAYEVGLGGNSIPTFGWIGNDNLKVASGERISEFPLRQDRTSSETIISARNGRIFSVKEKNVLCFGKGFPASGEILPLPKGASPSSILAVVNGLYLFTVDRNVATPAQTFYWAFGSKSWEPLGENCILLRDIPHESLAVLKSVIPIAGSKVPIPAGSKIDIMGKSVLILGGSSIKYINNGRLQTWEPPLLTGIVDASFVAPDLIAVFWTGPFSSYSKAALLDSSKNRAFAVETSDYPGTGPAISSAELDQFKRYLVR